MARTELDVLLDKVDEEVLRADLRAHIDRLRARRSYGLVFESHLPERVRLPDHPIRRGTMVVRRADRISPTYQVVQLAGADAVVQQLRHPDGTYLAPHEVAATADETVAIADLVAIADFGQPIHPGLRHLDSIRRGGDRPSQVVIKGENHHVLEALRFSHAGKIDCVYIDPPYNTGARDWKYDNDYVDDTDAYRHSKWLAFMERRLRLAQELLNPDDSVLIVTIDENEVHRLGLLLEQVFGGAHIQMVTIVINPSGAGGVGFNRVEEHAFFVFLGAAGVTGWVDNLLTDDGPNSRIRGGLSWESFLRSGATWYRHTRPNLCYPIKIDPEAMAIVGVGDPYDGDEADRPTELDGYPLAWPVRRDQRLGIWRADGAALMGLVDRGYAHVSSFDEARGAWAIKYLLSGTIRLIESGQVEVSRTGARGQVVAETTTTIAKVPKTVWFRPSHNAGKHGSDVIQALTLDRRFPYPKSLYAVEDALRFVVADKPDAVVLDFFGGSGTTTHAVARLNHHDGGRRQSILVTNNEVSATEAANLGRAGHRPGDAAWEALGIFEHVTRPRVTAAITGRTPNGEPVRGDYKFTDEFPMADGFEENVDFFELTYLDPDDVELDAAFTGIAPLLWLRAGAAGPVIAERGGSTEPYRWTDRYGVLFNPDRWRAFVTDRPATATTAFVVTDSPSTFAGIAAELPAAIEVVRLYESYLTTFEKLPSGAS